MICLARRFLPPMYARGPIMRVWMNDSNKETAFSLHVESQRSGVDFLQAGFIGIEHRPKNGKGSLSQFLPGLKRRMAVGLEQFPLARLPDRYAGRPQHVEHGLIQNGAADLVAVVRHRSE